MLSYLSKKFTITPTQKLQTYSISNLPRLVIKIQPLINAKAINLDNNLTIMNI